MKKLILPIVLCILTISTASAKDITPKVETPVPSVITLCDLIKKDDYKGVKAMLEEGQKVNEKSRGMTPLMYAAAYNRDKIAKLLIGYGADPKAISDNGKDTPLKVARKYKSKETYYVIKKAIDKQTKKKTAS